MSRVGTPEELISGSNCVVWRARTPADERVVVRVPDPGVDDSWTLQRLELVRSLVEAGVLFAPPSRHGVIRHAGILGVTWDDLGPSGVRDYESFGAAAASLHRATTRLAPDSPLQQHLVALPAADDIDEVRARLEASIADGVVDATEAGPLLAMADDMERFYADAPDVRCVVHDDLWEKNVIFTPAGAHLVDPDNLSWAFPDYDLAFIARAEGRDGVAADDLRAFESGYGAALPDRATANLLALPHQLRWLLQCATDRSWKPQAAASFDYDFSRIALHH